MTTHTRHKQLSESHHGVLLNISGYGVFIIGEAGIGKSSLALDFLHNGHSLIADDYVDFKTNNQRAVLGHCPPMLTGLLHTRELGLISLSEHFGSMAWQADIQLDYVIHLQKNLVSPSSLSIAPERHTICEQLFPMLSLDLNNPATVTNRINTWLSMQVKHNTAVVTLEQRQRAQMGTLQ
ncbi:MAG: serine kinase [Methylophaga sp.]|nr:serine kinase [Methylophaga sp.]